MTADSEPIACKEADTVTEDAKRKTKLATLMKEKEQLDKEKTNDRYEHDWLLRLHEDARLALRKGEFHSGSQNAEALTRAERLARRTMDEHASLLAATRRRGNLLLVETWTLLLSLWKELGCRTERGARREEGGAGKREGGT